MLTVDCLTDETLSAEALSDVTDVLLFRDDGRSLGVWRVLCGFSLLLLLFGLFRSEGSVGDFCFYSAMASNGM